MEPSVTLDAEIEEPKPTAPSLSYGHILKFYVPLGLSWMLMAIEAPISIKVIAELPNAIVLTAAFTAMSYLALFMESPVIDLLSTSATLAKNKQAFVELSRFVWMAIFGVTFIHAFVSLSPLYHFVAYHLLGLESSVAEATRRGLIIMIPWSGFIGWRRYLQGILIRAGQTKLISYGTFLRMTTIASTAVGLLLLTKLDGITITATSLVASVAIEALYVHIISRPVVTKLRLTEPEVDEQPLTIAKLFRFHFPLTMTTMLSLAVNPFLTAAISLMPHKTESLAAWGVAMTLGFLTRSFIFALPEVVITLGKTEHDRDVLRKFCILVGIYAAVFVVAICLTGFDKWFFSVVMEKDAQLANMAHIALFTLCIMPIICAMQSYLRGALTLYHYTSSRLRANIAGISALIVALGIGIFTQLPSVAVAAICFTISLTAELGALLMSWRKAQILGPRVLRNEPLKVRRPR